MIKRIKKISLLVLVLALFIPQYVFASSYSYNTSDSVTISERDMILELQSLSDSELLLEGYSQEEITQLRSISDQSILKEARMQSDTELKARGLTDYQIFTIRNEKNIKKAASAAYGNVTYTVEKSRYVYNSSKKITELSIIATWNWSSMPSFRFKDIIACTTSNKAFSKDSASGKVFYKLGTAGNTLASSSLSVKTQDSGSTTYATFNTEKSYTDTTHPRPTKIFAYSGNLKTTFTAPGKINTVGISSKYGHSIVSLSTSIGVSSSSFGISFTPTSKVKSGEEAYVKLYL